MDLSIDASNLLLGGGLKHLQCLLGNIRTDFFSRVIVYGPAKILEHLPHSSLIEPREISVKTSSLVYRFRWQTSELGRRLHAEKGVLFVPGGAYLGDYRPFVTMFRNMQIFESKELNREGFSKEWIRLRVLQRVQARTFLNSSGLICISEYAENYLKQFYPRLLTNTEVRRIPHGISQLRQTQREYKFDDRIRLLYVSTVKQYKHQWHLIDAVVQLRKEGFPLELHLVGSGDPPALSRMHLAIERHGSLGEFVYYHGGLSSSDTLEWYELADLFAYPSSCENLPNILLEAMSAALPIACSNRGPMPEVLRDAGVYFNPEQPESIAASLKLLLQDKVMRQTYGTKARSLSEAYSWELCAHDTFAFLESVSKRHFS